MSLTMDFICAAMFDYHAGKGSYPASFEFSVETFFDFF